MAESGQIQRYEFGDFRLQGGAVLEGGFLTFTTHGRLDADRSNAILILPSLMADRTRHDFLIGPGRGFDPDRYFIITVDTLGNGKAISPSNSRSQAGTKFPRFTILDMVNVQHRLVQEHLGIERLRAVAGLSMGGMQALQWAVAFPDKMRAAIAMISMARATPWVSAFWHAMRHGLAGDDADGETARSRLQSAIYHFLLMTRHWEWYQDRFQDSELDLAAWLDAEAERISRRWDATDFIYQSFAEDDYDLAATCDKGARMEDALDSIEAEVMLMPSSSDLLHPASELHLAARHIRKSRLVEIDSRCGHLGGGGLDAADAVFMNREIASFLGWL